MMRPATIAMTMLLLVPAAVLGQSSEAFRAMNRSTEPFRIAGNLYYVGANSVTSFLLVTPEGHILIDSGFPETVPLIRASMKKLGFEFDEIRILLNSHAHIDHAGGLAQIKQATGARLMASSRETPLLESGGKGDDLLGDAGAYPPVSVDRRLEDGDTVELGGTKLTARVTGGHTRGCTSWVIDLVEDGESRTAVSICSLSVLDGMKFLEDPTYPGIADDFRRSYETLRSIPCDIFLASHAGFFKMADKSKRAEAGAEPNPFIDPEGYLGYIDRAESRLNERLESEKETIAKAASGQAQ